VSARDDAINWTQRIYNDKVVEVADRLRAMADDVERAAIPHTKPGVEGTPRYTAAAAQVLHTIAWGVANADADQLVTRANLADRAEAGDLDPEQDR
jgi:hypothetical protein